MPMWQVGDFHEPGGITPEMFQDICDVAECGNVRFMMRAGRCLLRGIGTEPNIPAAMQWFEQAAQKECPDAYLDLGRVYDAGAPPFVERNPVLAQHYYDLALKGGIDDAEYYLANLAREREGLQRITPDEYFLGGELRVAESGNPKAMWFIAQAYIFGDGVPEDYEKAMEWLQRSANLGFPDSFLTMGELYFRGLGVESDLQEAWKYFRQAKLRGCKAASGWLKKVYRLRPSLRDELLRRRAEGDEVYGGDDDAKEFEAAMSGETDREFWSRHLLGSSGDEEDEDYDEDEDEDKDEDEDHFEFREKLKDELLTARIDDLKRKHGTDSDDALDALYP